jgi:predicted DNA-binding transcriptional regulator AlpA
MGGNTDRPQPKFVIDEIKKYSYSDIPHIAEVSGVSKSGIYYIMNSGPDYDGKISTLHRLSQFLQIEYTANWTKKVKPCPSKDVSLF